MIEGSPEEIFEKNSEEKEDDVSENYAHSLIREAFILQELAAKGVKGVPRVIESKSESDLVSPLTDEKVIGDQIKPTNFRSKMSIEKIPGENWYEHEFKGEAEVVGTAVKAAQILNDAFKAGYAHGDIKPENLMITPENNVFVIDFNGAVRHSKEKPGFFTPPAKTTRFASPERGFQSETEAVQLSSEIYSLTATIAESLGIDISPLGDESTPPETRKSTFFPNLVAAVNSGEVSQKLGAFILGNLEFTPSYRNQSYEDFITALKIVQDPEKTFVDIKNFFDSNYKKLIEKD